MSGRGFFAGRSLTALAAGLRAGEFSATDLAERALAAITELDPVINAFVTVDAEGALARASRTDEERARGEDRGPLHGIPVAIKDIVDVAGLPATMGSAAFADHVPETDATCVRRLHTAGATIIGKTTTHQFAYGPSGDMAANGPSRNPHDPTRMSGGSSGGSAAAVAAGMVPLAIGTDTGGSVRIPAAFCGVTGFKPAHGAIPADGVFPLAPSLDTVGVLAGSAEDCRIAYEILASTSAPDHGAGLRVAWVGGGTAHPVDPAIDTAVRRALDGLDVTEEALDLDGMREAYVAIQTSEAYDVHADHIDSPGRYLPEVLDRLRRAADVPGWRHVRALRARDSQRAEVLALLDRYDVLAMPTMAVLPPPIGERESVVSGRTVPTLPALLALTCPWNVAGVPAITVPAGMVDGLPVALQLIGAPGREGPLLALANRLEGAPA